MSKDEDVPFEVVHALLLKSSGLAQKVHAVLGEARDDLPAQMGALATVAAALIAASKEEDRGPLYDAWLSYTDAVVSTMSLMKDKTKLYHRDMRPRR